MARPRTAMRRIREVLRLTFEADLGAQQVSLATGLPRITVRRYLEKARSHGIGWPLPEELDDRTLKEQLFGQRAAAGPARMIPARPQPDRTEVHEELRRPQVTLPLLWQEYKEQHPNGYQYSWFAEHYRLWARQFDVVLRQEHRAGEKLFVDFAGQTVPIVDPATGEISQAPFFVAVLGACCSAAGPGSSPASSPCSVAHFR